MNVRKGAFLFGEIEGGELFEQEWVVGARGYLN